MFFTSIATAVVFLLMTFAMSRNNKEHQGYERTSANLRASVRLALVVIPAIIALGVVADLVIWSRL
jgi:hypothetical protein